MKWYEKLYIGKTAEKKKEVLIRGLEDGKRIPGLWVIALPEGESNQLELIPSWNLKFWRRSADSSRIVGIACSKEEAYELLLEITRDVLRGMGAADFRSWFLKQDGFR